MNNNKERFLLTETTQQFLLEVEGGSSLIEKAKLDRNIPIYLTGIVQSGDKPNRNNRYYPWEILKKEALRYLQEDVKHHQAYGELDHPEDSATPSLMRASHIIENIWFDENKKDIYARVKLLNAFAPDNCPSLKARSIILNGGDIGISSRALGTLKEGKGYDIVEDDLEIVCWDLVSKASNYGSEKMSVAESKTKSKTERTILLTESQCLGGNCNIGLTKYERVKAAKLHELNEEEKMYLNILGAEKFLQIKRKYNQFK